MAQIAITKVFVEPFFTLLMTAASAINSQSIMQKKKKKQSRAERKHSEPVHPATALFSNALPKLMSQANWSVIIATQELSRGSVPPLYFLTWEGINWINWFPATPRKSKLMNIMLFFPSHVVYLLLHLLLCGFHFAAACVCMIVKKKTKKHNNNNNSEWLQRPRRAGNAFSF